MSELYLLQIPESMVKSFDVISMFQGVTFETGKQAKDHINELMGVDVNELIKVSDLGQRLNRISLVSMDLFLDYVSSRDRIGTDYRTLIQGDVLTHVYINDPHNTTS